MSLMTALLAMLTIIGLSIGQLLFKLAADRIHGDASLWILLLKNTYLWLALCLYGLTTISWIVVLRQAPLRLAYPFVGLVFIIVPLLAHKFLDEPLPPQALIGAGFILLGICISTMWQ